jgi:hypothetical protein
VAEQTKSNKKKKLKKIWRKNTLVGSEKRINLKTIAAVMAKKAPTTFRPAGEFANIAIDMSCFPKNFVTTS